MPASSGLGPRPISPVEEDLQKLYNEVWAVFAEETPPSERDLENIYNGYADDYEPTPQSLAPVPQHTGRRSPSPYRVNTQNLATVPSPASGKSPTRRRLPPTPGGSSSSPVTPSVVSYAMPEPEVYYPPGASRPHMYNGNTSNSFASFASSSTRSSDPASGSSRRSADTNGRQPPGGSTSSSNTSYWDDALRTPVSDSQAHYPSSRNDVYQRPSGAQPPALPPKPSAYTNMPQNPYLLASAASTYDQEGPDAYDYASESNPYISTSTPTPPLPPLPGVNDERYASYPSPNTYTTSPEASSSYNGFPDFSLKNTTGAVSQNSFFDQPHAASSARTAQQGAPLAIHDPKGYDYGEQEYDDQDGLTASDPNVMRRPSDMLRSVAQFSPGKQPSLELHDDPDPLGEYWEDEDEEDETRFVNFSLLSNIAMQLRDKVPRGTHVKGSIPYPRAFTGKDIVSTIQTQIQRELAINHGVSTNDRRVALQVARSLQSQLFFYEVEWGNRVLHDGVEDVYMFLDDQESGSDAIPEREELPTSVITMLTRCYSPSCGEGVVCYAYSCPRKGDHAFVPPPAPVETLAVVTEEAWTSTVDAAIVKSLPQSEVNRQNIIHQLINREKQYLQDLDLVESAFIKPLRTTNPPVIAPNLLDDFIDDVFGNILDLRETNRRLLEVLYVRQREEGPIILRIGDIFLQSAAEFRFAYPTYIGHFPISEKRLKDETEANPQLKIFLDQCARQPSSRPEDSTRLELKSFLSRPADHLQRYTVHLEAVLHETAPENPDTEFLVEAIDAIKNLHSISQLRTFQAAMGKGAPGKWEWHDIVPAEVREHFAKKDAKRQAIIFELIKGEMAYVKDLENIQNMYIIPLRKDTSIIPSDRLDQFIDDVFHNYADLFQHHKKLVGELHEIQREQHPNIHSITAPLFDAALNFRDSYMEYIPNYPIAAYRIDDEMANNPAFKAFVDNCVRHPDAHRLDMKSFINRPIPRLLRYELLLKGILDETPAGHEDIEAIPQVVEVIKALGKETEPGVQSAKQKVEVWRYNANLIFKQGESIDMDLLDPGRSLIYSGKLLRQPESGLEWNGWSELHVLLFDNYLVMTKPKEKDGVTKYQVNRRPIPLDLLTLVNFTDPPTQRSAGILRNLRGGERHDTNSGTPGMTPDSATDSRSVFPLTLHHNGRTGGPYILYAESAQSRSDWKERLEHALILRKTVQESNKVFEIEYLSRETFVMPAVAVGTNNGPAWNQDNQYTGKVTCSVPFNTLDGRALVAIGCTEGVWIGFRHDPKSIRRVLHLKMVTQCAMLEDFGIFLVLADKALFAYHIEALVPSAPNGPHTSQVPQKLSGTKDVHFFSVGTLGGRTLIIYMKKKSLNSIFRVLEPVGEKINEGVKASAGFGSRLGFRSTKSEWFRIYRDFFLPSDSFDVIFLKARIAIFCAKGFEIMNLHDFDSITIPQRDDPRHAQLAKRCEAARPLGMFRSTEEEFLLCYDEFGLYVDKHGDPCRSLGTIEWEGTAERVAFHAPYILLFDSRFIEIRHIATGRLAQIIPGNEIRCTWDGRGVSVTANTPPIDSQHDNVVQEAQVHFVMNSTDSVTGPGGMRTRNIVQHVCELIPTVALFPTTQPSTAPPLPQVQYDVYNAPPTHMSNYSYGSSVNSTAHGYAPPMAQAYAPQPVPNSVNPAPGGGSYYTRGGQATMSPPRSPETSQTWR